MAREEEQFERIPTQICRDSEAAAQFVAGEIAQLIRERAKEGKNAVLGLATGSTPLPVYRELVRLHKEDGLSFRNVITFNLDEYFGLSDEHPESYHQFMWERLFKFVDIPKDQVQVPSGTVDRADVYDFCDSYEKAIAEAGGLDYQILGIGRTGHIGFNEPGSAGDSKTRLVTLDPLTRLDAARDFLGEANVPLFAITMGVGTILKARKLVLMAWGQSKASVVRNAVEGKPNENLPASLLQGHDDVRFFIDRSASEELIRFRLPWLVGSVEWTPRLIRKAVLWLSRKVKKPILKLQDSDYNEHGLGELLIGAGPAYGLNITVFNQTQHTITGWPGGKPNADETNRPERSTPFPKRVLVLGSEPHEDILCMGGTAHRLKNQGSEVTLAYLSSGNLAVPDNLAKQTLALMSELEREMDFKKGEGLSLGQFADVILKGIEDKRDEDNDSEEVRRIKALVRRNEARDAARILTIDREAQEFLDLPFYEKGRYRNFVTSEEDVKALVSLLERNEPHQIYVSGGLADPGSVSGVCYRLFCEAMEQLKDKAWMKHCRVWSYRGVGQEWPLFEIDMAVPLSPDELVSKVEASFQYRSQRSQFPFRAASHREIWQQTDEVNRSTAAAYDDVGMAEYEAIEAFKKIELEELLGS
ncbi:MAG: glucosamine-6-phosphate deaminase [Opitutales bacterium]|nr:glucosamine-6-phosphate deaminase [Opitutales bacterium]